MYYSIHEPNKQMKQEDFVWNLDYFLKQMTVFQSCSSAVTPSAERFWNF